MTTLVAEGLSWRVEGRTVVDGASLTLRPGELVALLGPNGAGKTTLLRMALGLLTPAAGRATLGGDDVREVSAHERARRIAYLPQARPLAWPARVRDVVALGRFTHGAASGRLSAADAGAVARALVACGLEPLAGRRTDTLSGGELARVHLARAMASEARLLAADEPTAALDPRRQHEVMGLLRRHVAGGGGVLAVIHDLPLAARYADRLLWMSEGRIVADGSVAETLTPERIAQVYGVDARIERGEPVIEGVVPPHTSP